MKLLKTDKKYKELKPHFINLTLSLDNVSNVYIDHCHLSPNGNEIITDLLIDHFEKK